MIRGAACCANREHQDSKFTRVIAVPKSGLMALSMSSRSCIAARRPATRPVKLSATAHEGSVQKSYFIATNNFKVKPDFYEAFEEMWRTRESRLKEMPGFVRFALLKCANVPGKYISQTTWASKEAFEAWANSNQFKQAHGGQSNRPNSITMMEGPPQPEFYETITITE